jgi:hypothetical protein
VHEVIESARVLEEVVETAHDAEDTKGEDPDTDDGDDGRLSAHEPAKEREEGGEHIDDQDGAGQLPRRDRRPEGAVGTGDEDEPVLSERDLEEEDGVHPSEVLHDTAVLALGEHGGQGDPGADGKDDTEEHGHTPELGEVPLDGSLGEGRVIVGDGEGGDIGENGDEDDELNVKRLVQDGDPETKEDLEMDGQSDTVDNVGVHAVENLAGSLESIDDGAETRSQEDDISGGAGSVRGTLDGNTGIGLLQGWGIVDTVTSHGNEVTTLLENLDDVVLVLGEDLSESISGLDEIVNLGTGHVTTTTETETLSVVDVGTETELAGGFTGYTDGITSQHLDGETESLGFVDGAGSIVTRGVRAGHDTENLPLAFAALAGNTEGTETTGSELSDLVLVGLVDVLWDGVVFLDGLQDEKGSALDTDDALALGRLDDGLDLLGDGIEGVELNNLVLGEDRLGAGVEAESLEEGLVDGIDTFLLAGGGQTGGQHEVIGLDTLDGEWLGEGELVLGERTGLVRAENLDTSKRLNGGQLLDDGLLLGEVSSSDGHGGGDDSGETDGDTNDGDGQGELEDLDNTVGAVERGDPDDQVGEDNEDEQHRSDAVQDLSEVTSAGGGLVDQGSGTTDESVVTSGGDDHKGLTTLDTGRSVTLVALVLVNSKGFTSDCRLIDLEEGIFGNDSTVSGDNGTLSGQQRPLAGGRIMNSPPQSGGYHREQPPGRRPRRGDRHGEQQP